MRYLDNSKKNFGILRNVLAYSCQGDIFAPYETQPRALVLWRLFFYIGLEVRVVFRKTIWIVSSLFFFSFYYNNHLLRSDSSKQKHNDFQNTTRSFLYRSRGPGCVFEKVTKHNLVFQSYGWRLSIYIGLEDQVVFRKTIWIVSSLFFFSLYCNNHLLRYESSKQKQNGFQNTTRCSSPIYGDSPSIQDQRTGLCFGK